MSTLLLTIWAVGLIGALLLTLVLLKRVFLVVGALQDILRLARVTEAAAEGIGRNVGVAAPLRRLAQSVQALPESVGLLAGASHRLHAETERLLARRG